MINRINEIWRDIPGYEGSYQVSNLGRIKSLDRVIHVYNPHRKISFESHIKGKIMTAKRNKKGYLFVHLTKDNKAKLIYYHRIVANVFIPNTFGYEQVNHIDNNKNNNSITNLEWCNCKQNIQHTRSKPIIGENIKSGRKIYYNSLSDVNRDGFSHGCVGLCIHGKQKTHKGFTWKYMEEKR